MPSSEISHYVSLSYLGIFLWFLIFKQLTPIPEEISLITVGYLSAYVALNPIICGTVAALAMLITDNLFFYLSLKGNKIIERFTRKIDTEWIDEAKKRYRENQKKALLIGAFLPKIRFMSPIVAGMAGISWKFFLWMDSVVTAFYVSLYLSLGFFFHSQLNHFFKKFTWVQISIFILVMIIIGIFISVKIGKGMKKRK